MEKLSGNCSGGQEGGQPVPLPHPLQIPPWKEPNSPLNFCLRFLSVKINGALEVVVQVE